MKYIRSHTHTEDAEDHEAKVTCQSELCECRSHSATVFWTCSTSKSSSEVEKKKGKLTEKRRSLSVTYK